MVWCASCPSLSALCLGLGCGLGHVAPPQDALAATQRRNGRAFSSLTARGGGLPVGVTRHTSCGLPENQGSLSTNGSHEPFHRIHMDFTQAIAVFIARERTSSMVDTLMVVALSLQTGIDAVLVCINQCAWMHGVFDERLDRLLLHMGEQMAHHVPPTLYHPKDGRFFLLQRATATFAFTSASTPLSALALDDCGVPFMAGCHLGFIALHL